MPGTELARSRTRRPGEGASGAGGGGAGSPGSALGRLRSDLRAMSFDEGAAALSPRGDGAVSGLAPDVAVPGLAPVGAVDGAAPLGAEASGGAAEPVGVAAIPPDQRRMVRYGSTGAEVTYAQERLNAHGADPALAEDGIFGPKTRKGTLAYQRSHALGDDAIIGPKTWASLDGPTDVGTSKGAGGGGGTGGGPGANTMLYDTTAYDIQPPAKGTKKDVPVAEIQTKQGQTPPELGKTIKVENVQTDSEEEVHLYWVIARLGERARWASETDLVTQVGYAPKTGGAAPKGRVTLRIDGKGNATATLLATGAPSVTATFGSVADAKTGLKGTFGLKDVVDGGATWSLDELNKVNAGFSKLSSAERAALAGVVLKRVHTIQKDGQSLDGLFETGHALSPDGKTATSEATLSLADSAFASDDMSFVGDTGDAAPASLHTIVHEAGHAVEEATRFQARKAKFAAQAEENRKVETFNAEVNTTNAAITALNGAQQTAFQKANTWSSPDKAAAKKYLNAVSAASTALGKMANNQKAADVPKRGTAADTAVQDRDTAKSALQSAAPSNPALAEFADVEAKQGALHTAAEARAAALVDWQAAKDARKDAEKAVEASESGGSTKRLKAFADFVKKHKIPPLTEYAQTGTGEFYAEAFSLFRNDPAYLLRVAPKLHAWFDQGEHLKG